MEMCITVFPCKIDWEIDFFFKLLTYQSKSAVHVKLDPKSAILISVGKTVFTTFVLIDAQNH